MQVNPLDAHAHKLTIVGLHVKSYRGRETLKEKLKPYLQPAPRPANPSGWNCQALGGLLTPV
jgi:hypothetical protein